MQTIINLIAISAMVSLAYCSVQPYKPINGTTFGKQTLYNNTLTPASATSTHQIIYSTPKSINPKVLLCLVDYEERDLMTDAYFKLAISASTLTSFNVELNCTGSAMIYLVSVMYLSLQDVDNAFYPLTVQFTSLSAVSTGSGTRQQSKLSNFYTLTGTSLSSNLSLNMAFVFINGFEMQAPSSKFSLSLEVSLTNSISFITVIKTGFDCHIQFASGMYLFIDKSKFITNNITVYSEIITTQNTTYYAGTPTHLSSNGHYILGLNIIKGVTGVSESIRFTIEIGSLIIVTTSARVSALDITYLFLGNYGCVTSFPFYSDIYYSSCVAQCASGEIQWPTNKVCSACTYPCSECYSTASNCTSCASGYTLQGQLCQQSASGVITASVGSKIYLLGLLGIIPISIVTGGVHVLARQEDQQPHQHDRNRRPTCHGFFLNFGSLIDSKYFHIHTIIKIKRMHQKGGQCSPLSQLSMKKLRFGHTFSTSNYTCTSYDSLRSCYNGAATSFQFYKASSLISGSYSKMLLLWSSDSTCDGSHDMQNSLLKLFIILQKEWYFFYIF